MPRYIINCYFQVYELIMGQCFFNIPNNTEQTEDNKEMIAQFQSNVGQLLESFITKCSRKLEFMMNKVGRICDEMMSIHYFFYTGEYKFTSFLGQS
jgi:hypothetical protein